MLVCLYEVRLSGVCVHVSGSIFTGFLVTQMTNERACLRVCVGAHGIEGAAWRLSGIG